MRFLGFLAGLAAVWALNRWAPTVVTAIASTSGFVGLLGAVAAALTSTWVIALNRLTVFEKLDDLSVDQKEQATARAREFRYGVLRSIFINSVTLCLALLAVPLGTASTLNLAIGPYNVAYAMLPFFGVWVGGFVLSIRVLHSIDESRIAIVETQVIEKQRSAYIQKMREDERKAPIGREDAHLNKYTRDSHKLQH